MRSALPRFASCWGWSLKRTSERIRNASTRSCTSIVNAASKWLSRIASAMTNFRPSERAAACASLRMASALELVGFSKKPIAAALGTVSWSSSNCFRRRLAPRKVTPVKLPPGRAKLATKPYSTGSIPVSTTTGMDAIAAFSVCPRTY